MTKMRAQPRPESSKQTLGILPSPPPALLQVPEEKNVKGSGLAINAGNVQTGWTTVGEVEDCLLCWWFVTFPNSLLC